MENNKSRHQQLPPSTPPRFAATKRFLTFAVLTVISLGLIKLIHMLFDLGEMDWLVIAIVIVMLYFGSYGLTIPFVKPKKKE